MCFYTQYNMPISLNSSVTYVIITRFRDLKLAEHIHKHHKNMYSKYDMYCFIYCDFIAQWNNFKNIKSLHK